MREVGARRKLAGGGEVGKDGGLALGVGGGGMGCFGRSGFIDLTLLILTLFIEGLGGGEVWVPAEFFQELGDGAGAGALAVGSGGGELGGWGEGAEDGVEGELVDDESGGRGGEPGVREVGGGDLETVEEEAGAFGVDVVGGEAAEDLADGELDGGAVLGQGEVKGGAAGSASLRPGDGAAGAVVEVAEGVVAEGRAAAAAAVGVDVAALEADDGGVDEVWHEVWGPHPLESCAKSSIDWC